MSSETIVKYCPQCAKKGLNPWKVHSEFYKDKARKDGFSAYCKNCHKEYRKGNGYKEPEEYKHIVDTNDGFKKYCSLCVKRNRNPWHHLADFWKESKSSTGYSKSCKLCRNENKRKRRKECEELAARDRARCKKWAKENPDKHNRNGKKWASENPEKVRESRLKRERRLYSTNLNYKLKKILRSRLVKAIKTRKPGSHVKDLGCSIEELISYIEAKFAPGMSWDNHGTVWELDHIEPLASFDLTDRDQFLEACCYTNLQPLTIEEHLEKTSKEVGR